MGAWTQGVGMRGMRSQATHVLFLLLLPGLTPLLSLLTDRAGKAGSFSGGLLRKPCRRHPRLCVLSGVLGHRDHEGSLPRAIRQETRSRIIQRSFGGRGPSDLAVPPSVARGTSPKRDARFHTCPGGTRRRSRTPQPTLQGKSPGQNQGFLSRLLLFGFSISVRPLNLTACCNTLCPKGLSIRAAPAKTWRGWRHTFKPGQAVTVNSSYSSIKSLQARTCRKVNLSPLALRQEMPWQGGARSERGQMCPAWKKLFLPTAAGSSAVPVCGSTGTAGMALGLVWGTAGSVVPV